MNADGIPPMAPLAPLVDRMRDLAREELPAPRTCTVTLWDDGTFDAVVYHSMGRDESRRLSYERTTGEIVLEHVRGQGWTTEEFADGETVHEPTVETKELRVVATVDPPYRGHDE